MTAEMASHSKEFLTPHQVQDALRPLGFVFGQEVLDDTLVRFVPHDTSLQELVTASLPTALIDCTAAVLTRLGRPAPTLPGEGTLVSLGDVVRVGRRQQQLLDMLTPDEFSVLSAYRSEAYQALLFAVRFLNGTLYDRDARLTTKPPGFSRHNLVDGALDISGATQFALRVRELAETVDLPFSLSFPYLCDPRVAFEPWHLDCVSSPLIEGRSTFRRREHIPAAESTFRRREAMIADSLSCNREPRHADNGLRVFVTGVAPSGAESCVGSCTGKGVWNSYEDAQSAIGGNWPAHFVTVPVGYTPLLGDILDHDVGRSTFLASSQEGDVAYLTSVSCAQRRHNTPLRVREALAEKLGLKPTAHETLTIQKARSAEFLVLPGLMIPSSFGLPTPYCENDADIPYLISTGIQKWLEGASVAGLPLYYSSDYCRTVSRVRDHTHLAHACSVLARHQHALRTAPELSQSLLDDYVDGSLWSRTSPTARVLLLTSACRLRAWDAVEQLWPANAAELHTRTETALRLEHLDDFFYVGHLANLLTEISASPVSSSVDISRVQGLLTDSFLSRMFRAAQDRVGLLASRSVAEVLLSPACDLSPSTRALAGQLLEHIMSVPYPPCWDEYGAFGSLPSIQSAVPLEALLQLVEGGAVPEADVNDVLTRVDAGLSFLRRLQLLPGSGVLAPSPGLLEGAVRYSLVDHHIRLDYAIHALNVAESRLRCHMRDDR